MIDYSLHVAAFNKGCLVMSSFRAAEDSYTILRNIIAFEHFHAAVKPFTSNYIKFINILKYFRNEMLRYSLTYIAKSIMTKNNKHVLLEHRGVRHGWVVQAWWWRLLTN